MSEWEARKKAELVRAALLKAETLRQQTQAGGRLHGRVYERLVGLLQASSDSQDASEAVKMLNELEKADSQSHGGLLDLVAGFLLVSKVYETHGRIDRVYARLGEREVASDWRASWEADRLEQQRRLMERVELSTTDMLVRELDAANNLKTFKRMAFELKLGAKASAETLDLLSATLRRTQPGIDLALDKRQQEMKEHGKEVRGQLLAQVAVK